MAASSLPREQVLHLARLARLKLDDEEVERLGAQLAAIVGYMDVLAGVARAEPDDEQESTSPRWLRDDESGASLPREAALSESERHVTQGFVVPGPKGSRR